MNELGYTRCVSKSLNVLLIVPDFLEIIIFNENFNEKRSHHFFYLASFYFLHSYIFV